MAESSRGLTLPRLRWTAEWHVHDEIYLPALAAILDCPAAHPLAAVWGPGNASSSNGQFFRAGGQGEARADRNARTPAVPGSGHARHTKRAKHIVLNRSNGLIEPFHSKIHALGHDDGSQRTPFRGLDQTSDCIGYQLGSRRVGRIMRLV